MTSGLALPLQVRVPWLHREQRRPGCLSEGCWLEGRLGGLSRTRSLSIFHPRCGHPQDWASFHYLPATGRCLSALSVAPRDSDNCLSLSAAHAAVHGVTGAPLAIVSTPRHPVPRELHWD